MLTFCGHARRAREVDRKTLQGSITNGNLNPVPITFVTNERMGDPTKDANAQGPNGKVRGSLAADPPGGKGMGGGVSGTCAGGFRLGGGDGAREGGRDGPAMCPAGCAALCGTARPNVVVLLCARLPRPQGQPFASLLGYKYNAITLEFSLITTRNDAPAAASSRSVALCGALGALLVLALLV